MRIIIIIIIIIIILIIIIIIIKNRKTTGEVLPLLKGKKVFTVVQFSDPYKFV